jgi:alcohol dehydrogenase
LESRSGAFFDSAEELGGNGQQLVQPAGSFVSGRSRTGSSCFPRTAKKGQEMREFRKAEELIQEFAGDAYTNGLGALREAGKVAQQLGKRAVAVFDRFPGSDEWVARLLDSLLDSDIEVIGQAEGARPNAPREDVHRISGVISACSPDLVLSFGGGSTIDAVKAAEVMSTLGGSLEDYFGANLVSQAVARTGRSLRRHLAIQTAASSGAHLTKYSNITNLETGQKKLIVDMAIVPPRAVFDYEVTLGAPAALTLDGALDGVSHCLEVLFDSVRKPYSEKMLEVAREGILLVLTYLPRALDDPFDGEARHALGVATDLGGYAIMLGGTNGAHLTSFSLVDVLSHGRACALMNPYYAVFFAPAVEQQLRMVGGLYRTAGYSSADFESLAGRSLGLAVAEAMIRFEQRVGMPTTLAQVVGFSDAHIKRALTAAKNPQLRMKLENMPVPLTAETVDEYMLPILEAAKTGDLSLIRNAD